MSGGFFLPRLTPEDPAAAYTVESTRYYCVDRRPGLNFKSGRLDQFLIEEVLMVERRRCKRFPFSVPAPRTKTSAIHSRGFYPFNVFANWRSSPRSSSCSPHTSAPLSSDFLRGSLPSWNRAKSQIPLRTSQRGLPQFSSARETDRRNAGTIPLPRGRPRRPSQARWM